MIVPITASQFSNFDEAARAALAFLHERLGFSLWMVTRTHGAESVVLQSENHGYDLQDGTVLRLADSLSSRMVSGDGPHVAPSSNAVPAYASAPKGATVKIAAYVGVPLTRADGSLFGTLCAMDPQEQPASILQDQPLIEMIASLLSTLLRAELQLADEARRAERSQLNALSDGLTGLFIRRGWQKLLDGEEQRCRRHGHEAAVIAVNLDGLALVNEREGQFAGDELISRAGTAVAGALRDQDVAARIGGDEFTLLAVECDIAGARALMRRLQKALDLVNVRASIGMAMRDPVHGLEAAWAVADAAMYLERNAARTGRPVQLLP